MLKMKTNKLLKIIPLLIILMTFSLISQSANQRKFETAIAYEANGDYENSIRIYKDLFESEPTNDNYFFALAKNLKRTNKFTDLLRMALKRIENKKDVDSYNILAEMQWKAADFTNAKLSWAEALKFSNDTEDNYLKIATSQSTVQSFDLAILTLKEGRNKSSNELAFSDELTKLYVATNDYKNGYAELIKYLFKRRELPSVQGRIFALISNKEASDYILSEMKDLASSESKDLLVQELYAWLLRTTKNFNQALDVVTRIDRLRNSNGFYLYDFAEISRKDEEFDIAIKAYEIIIDSKNMRAFLPNALFGYAQIMEAKYEKGKLLNEAKLDEVIERYYRVLKEAPNPNVNSDCLYRIAQLQLKRKKYDEAKATLETLLRTYQNSNAALSANLLLGDIEFFARNFDKAALLYKDLILKSNMRADDRVETAKLRLADIQLYQLNIDSAYSIYSFISQNTLSSVANDAINRQMLITSNKKNTTGLKLYLNADFERISSNPQKALELYSNLFKQYEEDDLGEFILLEICKIYIAQDDSLNAISKLNDFLLKFPASNFVDDAQFYLAGVYENTGNKAEAIENYTKLLRNYPNSIYCESSRLKIRKLRDGIN